MPALLFLETDKNLLVILASRKSTERDPLCRPSNHRSSARAENKRSLCARIARVQLKMRCLSPAGVTLIREEASRIVSKMLRQDERESEGERRTVCYATSTTKLT